MTLCFHKTIKIHPVPAQSGITIWYSNIPAIISSIFNSGAYHNYYGRINELFKKEDFAFSCFHPNEIQTVNRFKALKKQAEWIGGRYLIKQMLQTVFFKERPLEEITLDYRTHGAPFVKGMPDIEFSLSHSNDYTAAACSTNPGQILGIDIEKIAEKPDQAFLKTAFTDREIMAMPDDAAGIFMHWTLKEAYLKYIKKGFNESLHKVEVINDRVIHHGKDIAVDLFSAKVANGYILSLVSD